MLNRIHKTNNKLSLSYLVEMIKGENICNDTGTSNYCASASHLLNLISSDKNPFLSALKLAYNTANVFKLFGKKF